MKEIGVLNIRVDAIITMIGNINELIDCDVV
jgi:hypothetical protein